MHQGDTNKILVIPIAILVNNTFDKRLEHVFTPQRLLKNSSVWYRICSCLGKNNRRRDTDTRQWCCNWCMMLLWHNNVLVYIRYTDFIFVDNLLCMISLKCSKSAEKYYTHELDCLFFRSEFGLTCQWCSKKSAGDMAEPVNKHPVVVYSVFH